MTLLAELEKLSRNKLSEYVFTNPDTRKPYFDIRKCFRELCKQSNINGLVFHDLRHTAATRMVDSSVDFATIQSILGHADLKTTSRYVHPVTEQRLRAIEALDNYNKIKVSNN